MTAKKETVSVERFDISGFGWLINSITAKRWGNELTFDAHYDGSQPDTTFKIIFKDCHKIEWLAFGIEFEFHENDIARTVVIGMDVGEDQHRKPAIITTNLFELWITYGELIVEKDW
jgi:hypothetical protein